MKSVIFIILLALCSCSRNYGSLTFQRIESGRVYERKLKKDYRIFDSIGGMSDGHAYYYENNRLVARPPFRTNGFEPFIDRIDTLIALSEGDDVVIEIKYIHESNAIDGSSKFYLYIVIPEVQIGKSFQIEPDSDSFSVGYSTSAWGFYRYDEGVGYIRFDSRYNDELQLDVNITYEISEYSYSMTTDGNIRFDIHDRINENVAGTIIVQKGED